MGYKLYLFLVLICLSFTTLAQTGIGTTTPNASAKLDVYSTNKGFLPPRVTLTSVTDATTIATPAEGLLVYNLGSVGLQAGYYYWNGANWATIATATSAGNGVTASDMVKIYDGVGNAATINVNGATFSVTTSGKYQIDFSASATCGNCNFTVNFQVRDGANSNAIIASDRQTSYSNNVHAEYNGKVEVNLQAGRSYNVLVTTTGGGIYDNDYVRVYLKQVSGNLPVTGQTVDYVSTSLSNSYSNVGSGYDIVLQQLNGGNIPYNTSTGVYTLTANKTYMLQAQLRANTASAGGAYLQYTWVDATTNTPLVSNSDALISSSTSTAGYGSKEVVQIIYTPTTNQTIKLRSTANSGTQSIVMGSAVITQIGSSAIINPWILSGTNTSNTTGNVGIGNNSPTTTLDVTGTGKFSSSIINSGNRTYLGKDGASMHWLATTDAVAEPNNLAYGFESNGSSIQSHKWYTGGTQKMQLMSSGKLGLGTATPGTSLHIENGNTFGTDPSNTTSPSLYIYNNNSTSTAAHASATIRSNSSSGGNPYLSFDIAGVRGYSVGIDNADGDKFKIQNSWNFSSNPILTLTTDNRVGIGTTSPAAPLHVASNVTQYVGPYGYLAWNGSTGASSISQNINYSIQTDERIRAPEFNAISDLRIKKEISILNTANQLTELNKLSPVNYAYIDQLVNGNKRKTGFIAQEVERVNPQFVNKSTDFIPSVFALAKSVTTENGMLKMTTEKPHDFAKGDVIKIFSEGKKEVIKTIEEVIDLHSFSIKGWNEPLENLFIYGKK